MDLSFIYYTHSLKYGKLQNLADPDFPAYGENHIQIFP